VALTVLPLDLGRNLRPPPQSRSPTRLGPQAVLPLPVREPHPPPELGHEPLAAASPGLLSTCDGLTGDPKALSACRLESAGHSLHHDK
jgi:hypothetical protein